MLFDAAYADFDTLKCSLTDCFSTYGQCHDVHQSQKLVSFGELQMYLKEHAKTAEEKMIGWTEVCGEDMGPFIGVCLLVSDEYNVEEEVRAREKVLKLHASVLEQSVTMPIVFYSKHSSKIW